jgi:hypothetical protein
MHNPLGFGEADYIELALAACLVALYFIRPLVEPLVRKLAEHTGWSMLVLFLLPIALRLALLPNFPVPTPTGSDDFSHLLVADTLRHFRLANPTHPFHQFFEAIFILQQPTYSSMYPPGHGMVLALGRMLFGTPWAGVLICGGAFCALCYWMLRAWVSPVWAFAGGLLAVVEFGPLNQWMNTYWTSAIPAIAGCLVFGALPRMGRLKAVPKGPPSQDWLPHGGALLGIGLALHLITRPFEFLMLAGSAAFFVPLVPWRVWRSAVLILLPAAALLLLQNKAVTGSWTTLPYQLSRFEYGIPATFAFQPNPTPHRSLTPEQDLNYRAECAIHGDQPETIGTYLERLVFGMRYYRFFVLPPLYPALIAFLTTLRERRYKWVAGSAALFILACNLYPYFYPHYAGATASLFVLMCIVGLQKLNRWNIGRLLFFLCIASLLCWYGIRLSGREELFPALAYDEWDFVNHGDPEGRIAVNQELAQSPGKQLVFVHYAPQHKFHEWIHNEADIDAARVVWALDLGEEENNKLMAYYPDRHVWMVEPDAQPPRLRTLSY